MWLDSQHYAPAVLPPRENQCPLYKRLGGSQGQSVRARKISPRPGFDPRRGAIPTTLFRLNHSDVVFNSTNVSGLQQQYCIVGSLSSLVIRLQTGGPRHYLIRGRAQRTFLFSDRKIWCPPSFLFSE